MKQLVLYFVVILLLTSCELVKQIEFEPDYDGGKIIAHGFISKNSGVQVQISKSVPSNDTHQSSYIPDVQVTLYADNFPVSNLYETDSCFFISPDSIILKEGVAYKIIITTKDYGTAESGEQYILPSIDIDSLIYRKDTINWKGEKLLYSFYDPENNANYYSFYYDAFHDVDLIRSSKPDDSFILSYFDDRLFNGQKTWREESFYSTFYKFDTVLIVGRLFNISKEFKTFLESLNEYEYTKEDPFFEYTSPVYSNIKNGYGIFGSYTFSEKKITHIKPK